MVCVKVRVVELRKVFRVLSFVFAFGSLLTSFAEEPSWSQVIARARASVVLVQAELPSGVVTGSGAIISSDGYILTAAHVVYRAKRIQVLVGDKDWYEAALVAIHPKWRPSQAGPSGDVAVVKIPAENLSALPLGDVNQLEYEAEIRVLGYSLPQIGLGFIAVAGTVQGVRTTPEGVQLIQHNAPSDQGHSGGPVLNRRGEIVGIEIIAYETEWSKLRLAVAISSAWEVIPPFVVTLGSPRPEGISVPKFLPSPPLSMINFHLAHTLRPMDSSAFWSSHIALSPDGKILATVAEIEGKAVIELWETHTGVLLRRVPTGQTSYSWAFTFSPDGSLIAYSNEAGFIGIWEVATGSLVRQIHYLSRIMSIAFSTSGVWLAAGTDHMRVAVWNVKTGEKLVEKIVGQGYVHALAFSPDDTLLAMGLGWPDNLVSVWDTRTWRQVAFLAPTDLDGTPLGPRALAFSSDGSILAVGTGTLTVRRNQESTVYLGRVFLWQKVGTAFKRLGMCGSPKGTVRALAFAAGRDLLLVSYDNAVTLCDLRILDSPQCFFFPKEYWHKEGFAHSAAISSDGTIIVINRGDFVTVWELSNLDQR